MWSYAYAYQRKNKRNNSLENITWSDKPSVQAEEVYSTQVTKYPIKGYMTFKDVLTSRVVHSYNNKLSVLKTNKEMGAVSRQRDGADGNYQIHL